MSLIIAVDSGHGMETPGKQTPPLTQDVVVGGVVVRRKGETIREKEWNRPTADFLMAALQRCGMSTVDVSPGTTDVPLAERVKRANDAQANLFVSKHFNAAKGTWWTPGYTVCFICPDNKSTYTASQKAAKLVQDAIAAQNGWRNDGAVADTAYLGYSLYVLRNTVMPSMLTEAGFMDVFEQAQKMLDPAAQQADAEATCKGICQYFDLPYIAPGATPAPPAPSGDWTGSVDTTLNLRDAPNANAKILRTLPAGAPVTLLALESNGWYHLTYQGTTGYANGNYITAPSQPAPPPPTTDYKALYEAEVQKNQTLTTQLAAANNRIAAAKSALG